MTASRRPPRTGCQWIEHDRPFGSDPFCGAPRELNSSYCSEHRKRAITGRLSDQPILSKLGMVA